MMQCSFLDIYHGATVVFGHVTLYYYGFVHGATIILDIYHAVTMVSGRLPWCNVVFGHLQWYNNGFCTFTMVQLWFLGIYHDAIVLLCMVLL